MAAAADDAFYGPGPVEKRQKLGDDALEKKLNETDDDGQKKLYETDDNGEKKQEDEDDPDFDDDELQKIFFPEIDLSWMKNRQIPESIIVLPVRKEEEYEECVDPDDNEQIKKSLRLYSKQVKESKGFDVDEFPDLKSSDILGLILPFSNLSTQPKILELVNILSDLAITLYNQDNGVKYKFVKAQKANTEPAVGVYFYITFEAKSDDEDQPKLFQAKVLAGVNDEHRVESCWPKPTP